MLIKKRKREEKKTPILRKFHLFGRSERKQRVQRKLKKYIIWACIFYFIIFLNEELTLLSIIKAIFINFKLNAHV